MSQILYIDLTTNEIIIGIYIKKTTYQSQDNRYFSTKLFESIFCAQIMGWGQRSKLVQVWRPETCCFLDGPVNFLKISMKKVQNLRKWVFGSVYFLL
jgi:hypothetical protein